MSGLRTTAYGCTLANIFFTMIVCLFYYQKQAEVKDNLVFFDLFYQIARDWEVQPFVEI